MRQAAAEYDRLETVAIEREQLQEQVFELVRRVSALEAEVQRLRSVPLGQTASSSADDRSGRAS